MPGCGVPTLPCFYRFSRRVGVAAAVGVTEPWLRAILSTQREPSSELRLRLLFPRLGRAGSPRFLFSHAHGQPRSGIVLTAREDPGRQVAMIRATVVATILCAATAIAVSHAAAQEAGARESESELRLEVSPERSILDQPLRIRISGLLPGEEIELRGELRGYFGAIWEAAATFEADSQGIVDPAEQAPIAGSYDTLDPMGIFWSMTRVERTEPPEEEETPGWGGAVYPGEPMTVILTAEARGRTAVADTVERLWADGDVVREPVTEAGLVGTLFIPPGTEPMPAIIVPHGGYCFLPEAPAALLSTHGFVTLALQYCGAEGLPKSTGSTIPLEYFETAIEWLKTRTEVEGRQIGVVGMSLGGLLGLLLGSRFEDIKAVVSIKGSGVIVGFDFTFRGEPIPRTRLEGTETLRAAIRAEQPPECKPETPEGDWSCFDWVPVHLNMLLFHGLTNPGSLAQGVIPVEKINGPVLLVSGFGEGNWPSTLYTEVASRRLELHDFPFPYEHLAYPGAGHRLGVPYTPRTEDTSGGLRLMGGNPRDAAAANADYWPRMIRFLQEHLGNQTASGEERGGE